MKTPNALAFDAGGNLYVSDSEDGTVWRFPPTGLGTLWIRHTLLAPDPSFGVGANGIAFVPPRSLYVANTDQGLIARIPIQDNGQPGEPEVVAASFELLTVDGLAADVHGDLHAVIAGAALFGTAPLVQVDPESGEVTPSTSDADSFDFPTSLAFGGGPRDHRSVYVVNAGLFPEDRPDAAPGIVRVGVNVPGLPAR
jgi:sugar lactone lactonase YvrE